jgi:tRNA1Val (adenine37-N6)-methyltransferase
MVPAELSQDSLFNGRLQCLQHRHGYRFSLDAVLLARFITPKPDDKICDLGTGCGIISLIMAFMWPEITISGLEIQPGLAKLARENIELNNFQKRINIIQGDLRQIKDIFPAAYFDRVVCNPPYGKIGAGRQNKADEQLIARHEIKANLADVIRAAAFVVKNRGRVVLVYPASRCAALLAELRFNKLEPKRLRIVYSYPDSPGKLVLVEAVKNGGEELNVLPPFYVYQEPNGEYSPEMAACYEAV